MKQIEEITAYTKDARAKSLKDYLAMGGYEALKKTLHELSPDDVIATIKDSQLRGCGGAGFPAGVKWSFVPKDDRRHILICNADESEPGTFKDRVIMENAPHLLIEGILTAAYANRADTAYIYIRGEYPDSFASMNKAIEEAYAAGYLGKNILGSKFSCDLVIDRGSGAYICGEEMGLISSLEGRRGYPRPKPPFPATAGAWNLPTTVNNVETLTLAGMIMNKGVDWFKSYGREKNYGPKLYCVSGHVKKQGVYEFPMGINLKELIYEHCGGIRNDNKLKAVIPGGSSVPLLKASEIDVAMDFDALQAKGTFLGSAAVIVMDETVDMVRALWNITRFYTHETCGQCVPCREGCRWMLKIIDRILKGNGKESDLDLLCEISDNINGRTICALGAAAAMPVKSFVTKFRDEFMRYIKSGSKAQVAE